MKIFLLKIKLESKENIKSNFYYSILGSILNLFQNDQEIYESIQAISPLIKQKENFLIKISILGEKNFNKIVNKTLDGKKELNLDGIIFKVLGIDFSFGILDLDKIIYTNFESILIDFKSPTFIKTQKNNKQINHYLPEAKKFFISAIRKYLELKNENFKNLRELTEKIEKNFFIGEFNIHTKQVKIKSGIKAGVVGSIKYKLLETNDLKENEIILINNALKLANYIGLGNGKKLGLGQIKIKLI